MVVRDDTLCCFTFSLSGVMGVWILGRDVVTLFGYILSSSATLEYGALCVFTTVARIYKISGDAAAQALACPTS